MKSILSKSILILLLLFVANSIYGQDESIFKKTLKMEGRIMYDFTFLNAGTDYSFNGNEFRRVRLAAKGKVTQGIGYKIEFDFAGGKVGFRDVYLKMSLPQEYGNILIGSFTEPTSLDNMTSSKYITFIERSMLTNTQPFKYNAGFMYENLSFFENRVGLQVAYTFNGDKSKAYFDNSLENGGNFTGRLSGVAYKNKEKNQVIHLGINYEHRKKNSNYYHYKFRPENHMGSKISVGTPDILYLDDYEIDPSSTRYDVEAFGNFKNTSDTGFELAATSGSLSFQTEYEMANIITDIDTYTANNYYAFVSYFLTGEHRPYKKNSFGRVKPKQEFCLKEETYGALELVARYSVMDFSAFPEISTDKKIANITLGLNWYLNKHTKIAYNYTNTNFNDFNTYGSDKLSGHLIRFQVDF